MGMRSRLTNDGALMRTRRVAYPCNVSETSFIDRLIPCWASMRNHPAAYANFGRPIRRAQALQGGHRALRYRGSQETCIGNRELR